MMFCKKCGAKLGSKDKFCPNCGSPIMASPAGGRPQAAQPPQGAYANQGAQPPQGGYANQGAQPPQGGYANQAFRSAVQQNVPPTRSSAASQASGNVRYVQVDPQTGKIASSPHGKSRSESFMQWMTIAFIAIGLVIVMVAGSMFISGYMVKSVFADNVVSRPIDDFVTSEEELQVSSEEEAEEISSETDFSSEAAGSSEEISSEAENKNVPEKLRASYIQSHLKGKWTTSIPYKSMSLPATLVFDGKGKCSCEMKALFITKKFDGTYTVKDGGRCAITLNGLDEYVSDGNTLEGDIEIVKDDKINFTVGDVVWELNRA